MNIFVLAWDIERCGLYHCDQPVVKMILESAQIACRQHSCMQWATASQANLHWLDRRVSDRAYAT